MYTQNLSAKNVEKLSYSLLAAESCHLCDEAMNVLLSCAYIWKMELQKVDIYQDKGLLLRYKFSIPVLRCNRSARALKWPFDLEKLEEWLEEEF